MKEKLCEKVVDVRSVFEMDVLRLICGCAL